MNLKYHLLLPVLVFFFLPLFSQTRTVGVVTYSPKNQDGYVLYSPNGTKKTYLLDKCGRVVNTWTSNYIPGFSASLQPNGNLVRAGHVIGAGFGPGVGGVLEIFDWDGNLKWQYKQADTVMVFHHDFKVMPNGNILAIVWENHTIADALAHGRNPAQTKFSVWSERIQEIKPVGADSAEIVWEWKVWDHMVQDYDSTKKNYGVVPNHRELFDINFTNNNKLNTGQDWLHFNGIDYNEALDQILLTSHSLDEIYIIDHSTTTLEAATHSGGRTDAGGDILYRWGNSLSYRTGDSSNWRLFNSHHANWVEKGLENEGQIIFFNNGLNRPGATKYSTIGRINPPLTTNGLYTYISGNPFGPIKEKEVYKATKPTDFYTDFMGGVYQISDSHILATLATTGRFLEISNDTIVWEYVNPINSSGATKQGVKPIANSVFRCQFYPPDYGAFNGRNLTPGLELEAQPYSDKLCDKPLPPLYSIKKINTQNKISGISDSLNVHCRIAGVLQSNSMGESGSHYFISDITGSIYIEDTLQSGPFNMGDSVVVTGYVGQKNGWGIITKLDSMVKKSSNKLLRNTSVISHPDELHESALVKIKKVKLTDPLQWPTIPITAGKFARVGVKHTDGTIDSMYIYSITNLNGSIAPEGYFNVTGFVGQADATSPYLSNHFIIPISKNDIENSILPVVDFIGESDSAIIGNSNYSIGINNNPAEENFTADLVIKGGSAINGEDFSFTNQQIYFTVGNTQVYVPVTILAPTFSETRSIEFALRNVSDPGTIGDDTSFVLYLHGKRVENISDVPNNHCNFYPNPATAYFNVQSDLAVRQLAISDITGKTVMVLNSISSGKPIAVNDLRPGTYTVKIEFENGKINASRLIISSE
ncbi:MAG: aryl-sulfate sulfotransferase [Bacteroidetes bacterium]|nr:aryl-sulfate sulfotransferase [Bacteroidota bacterium]